MITSTSGLGRFSQACCPSGCPLRITGATTDPKGVLLNGAADFQSPSTSPGINLDMVGHMSAAEAARLSQTRGVCR